MHSSEESSRLYRVPHRVADLLDCVDHHLRSFDFVVVAAISDDDVAIRRRSRSHPTRRGCHFCPAGPIQQKGPAVVSELESRLAKVGVICDRSYQFVIGLWRAIEAECGLREVLGNNLP